MKKNLAILLALILIMAIIPVASNYEHFIGLITSYEEQTAAASVISDIKNSDYKIAENTSFTDKQSGEECSRSTKSLIYSLAGAAADEAFCEDEVKSLAVAYHTQICREGINGTLCIDTADPNIYLSESELKSKFGDSYTTFCSYCDNVYTRIILADGEPANLNLLEISSSQEKNAQIPITANPYCSLANDYITDIAFDTDTFCEIASTVNNEIDTQTSPQQMIGDITYSDNGEVESIIIGGTTVSGDETAAAFELPYKRFTLVYALDEFQFCVMQNDVTDCLVPVAAHIMAEQGNSFEEIINYFYPEV